MLITHQRKFLVSGVIHTGINDHSLIFKIRKVSVIDKQENILEIRNIKNFKEEKFTEELLKQPWKHVHFCAEDPSAMWEIWKKLFLDVLDKHAPFQHKKIRSIKASSIKNDVKTLIITRDGLKRKAILTNHENDWLNFKTTKSEANINLRNAKKINIPRE